MRVPRADTISICIAVAAAHAGSGSTRTGTNGGVTDVETSGPAASARRQANSCDAQSHVAARSPKSVVEQHSSHR
jgi:hypothetical protein